MNTDGNEEDGDQAKKENGVNEYGDSARLHVDELDGPALSRQLEKKSWSQQHKEHDCYHHRPPISHLFLYGKNGIMIL